MDLRARSIHPSTLGGLIVLVHQRSTTAGSVFEATLAAARSGLVIYVGRPAKSVALSIESCPSL